jgi:hypothetical protein
MKKVLLISIIILFLGFLFWYHTAKPIAPIRLQVAASSKIAASDNSISQASPLNKIPPTQYNIQTDADLGLKMSKAKFMTIIGRAIPEFIYLSPAERERLLKIYLEIQDLQNQIRGQLMHVDKVTGTNVVVSIPPYPKEGKELKALLQERLLDAFQNERAEKIDAYLGRIIDETYHEFGTASETFAATQDPNGSINVSCTWTIPDPPNGDLSSTLNLGGYVTGFSTGEFAFIYPILKKSFPTKTNSLK